jgi:hypothetical protein
MPLSTEQFDNLEADIITVGQVATGSAEPGVVLDRLGQARKTLAKLEAEAEAQITTLTAYNPRGAWVGGGTAYAPRDVVTSDGIAYLALTAHNSAASFATDLAADRWVVHQGLLMLEGTYIVSRTAMAALATMTEKSQPLFLTEVGREGTFIFVDDDLTAKVTSDPEQGIYVAPDSDTSGASGAWVRQYRDGGVYATWFGDTNPIQSALDYLASCNGGTLFLPPVSTGYVVSAPLVWTSQAPIRIEGVGLGSARPYATEGQTAIKYTGAKGTIALTIETDGADEGFPGVTVLVKNLLIYREDIEAQADDGSGLMFRGCHRVEVDTVGIWGFANGIETNDNPSAAGATSIRCNNVVLRRVDVRQAARHRIRIRGSAETVLEYCMGEADPVVNYVSDLYCGPGTNGGRTDAIKAISCTFIGGTEVVADMPDYNVQLDRILWAVFTGCAFERAKSAGLQVNNASGDAYTYSVDDGQWFGVYTYGCEFNGQGNICIDVFRSRFAFRDTVMHQMSLQEGVPYEATHAAIRVRAGVDAQIPALGGLISGGMIHFSGPMGIDIDNAASIAIDGGMYFVDATDTGKLSVTLGAYTSNCSVLFNNGDGSTSGVLDNGSFNTIFNNAIGYAYNQGASHNAGYVNGTLDGSGNATIAHGIANFTDYALEVTANYLTAGAGSARAPLTVNSWSNTSVSVSGGAPAAGKSCRVHYTIKMNGTV